MNNKLKILLEILPITAFFIAYKWQGLILATGLLTALTLLSLSVTYYQTKKISSVPLITGVLVTIFGTLTILLHDEQFIKIKPTLVSLVFATILLGGLVFKKSFFQHAAAKFLTLSDEGWRILSLRYGLFFLFLAGLNEVVWRNFSTDSWVNFKVFGMFGIIILFSSLQIPLLKKHHLED